MTSNIQQHPSAVPAAPAEVLNEALQALNVQRALMGGALLLASECKSSDRVAIEHACALIEMAKARLLAARRFLDEGGDTREAAGLALHELTMTESLVAGARELLCDESANDRGVALDADLVLELIQERDRALIVAIGEAASALTRRAA